MADATAVNSSAFVAAAASRFGAMNDGQAAGLIALVDQMAMDQAITDPRWAAYMLATVKHECANRWQPIAEFGHGQGRPYGLPVKITDGRGGQHTNIYYGRGYVQLTWEGNYRKMGQAIGLGDALWVDPDLALDPATAYSIMSHGMRTGIFTGRKLAQFIAGTACDFVEARTIINGHDQAPLIADYAAVFEAIYESLAPAAAEPAMV